MAYLMVCKLFKSSQSNFVLFCLFVCLFVFVVPNEEGMDITTADSEPMLRRGDVGYEEQVSEIQRKVLHRRYTGIAQDLDNSSFFSYDTEATTTPRCGM